MRLKLFLNYITAADLKLHSLSHKYKTIANKTHSR